MRRRVERAEAELAGLQLLQSGLLDGIEDHAAVLQDDGVIVAVNEAWETFARANGDPRLEHTGPGHNYLDVCSRAAEEGDADARKVLRGLQSVLHGEAEGFEHVYPCDAPGRRRWFKMRAVPLTGPPNGLFVAHRNVTDRHEALLEEQQSKLLVRAMAERGAVGLMLLDILRDGDGDSPNLTCAHSNAAAGVILGHNRSDCAGRTLRELVLEHPGTDLLHLCEEAAATGEVVERELTYLRDGEKRYLQVSTAPLGDRLAVILREHTEHTREELLREMAEKNEKFFPDAP